MTGLVRATASGERDGAELMEADQYQHDHENYCSGGHQANDDHPDTGQADQVPPGCARFCVRFTQFFLLVLGLAQLRPRSYSAGADGWW